MRYLDNDIVKFWIKGPAYHYTTNTVITMHGSPWERMSEHQRKDLRTSITQGISLGGPQSLVGHVYNHLCMCVKPKWWAIYDSGRHIVIHAPYSAYNNALQELHDVFTAFGKLQPNSVSHPSTFGGMYQQPVAVTHANLMQDKLFVLLTGKIGRRVLRREIYKRMAIDTDAQAKMFDLIESKPVFHITYDNESEPTISLGPKEIYQYANSKDE